MGGFKAYVIVFYLSIAAEILLFKKTRYFLESES